MNETPEVSIIIPCYNQGVFLNESVNSALSQKVSIEVIIVDDGSNDVNTCNVINQIQERFTNVKVLKKANGGLSSARNFGIEHAQAPFILPLDADDKISLDYLLKTLPIIKNDNSVGIVYTKTGYFGSTRGVFKVPPYKNVQDMLFSSLINCTALYKKNDWERVGGYSEEMNEGMEDYDFWLSLIKLNIKIVRVDEILFFYRKYRGSMVSKMNDDVIKNNYKKIFRRHQPLYIEHAPDFLFELYKKQAKYHKFEKIIKMINYISTYIHNLRKKYFWIS